MCPQLPGHLPGLLYNVQSGHCGHLLFLRLNVINWIYQDISLCHFICIFFLTKKQWNNVDIELDNVLYNISYKCSY